MSEFQTAYDDFLDVLSESEKRQFAAIKTSSDLLEELKKFQDFSRGQRKWTKLFRSVQKCSETLSPYFDVLGILVQAQVNIVGNAWGAFRLILLV
jgi:hypothetical protein